MNGLVEIRDVDSMALRGNALNDSHIRKTPIYLPPGYAQSKARYPVVYFLHGFGSGGLSWLSPAGFSLNVPERVDRLIFCNKVPPFIGVFVDGWTKLGGSQWLNSDSVGAYRDYLVKDVVGFVDGTFRTLAQPSSRAVVGKSSGGFGALWMGALHSDVFGFVGCHSGDAYFEYGYLPEFPKAAGALRKSGGVNEWLKDFYVRAQETRMRGDDHAVINVLAMSAVYSPSKKWPWGFELPFDIETGRIQTAVWEQWLTADPVRFIPRHLEAFKALKGLFLDCGNRDEFHLQWGARMVKETLESAGVPLHYEEFDDGHMGINYRYDRSMLALLPKMAIE